MPPRQALLTKIAARGNGGPNALRGSRSAVHGQSGAMQNETRTPVSSATIAATRMSVAQPLAAAPVVRADAPGVAAPSAATLSRTAASITGHKASQTSLPGNHARLQSAAKVPPIASLWSKSCPVAPAPTLASSDGACQTTSGKTDCGGQAPLMQATAKTTEPAGRIANDRPPVSARTASVPVKSDSGAAQ